MDLATLPQSRNGNIYIIIIVDRLSSFVEAGALPNKEALTIVKWIHENIVWR